MNLDKFYRRKISISEVIDCARLFNDDDTDKFAKFPYIYISSDEDVYGESVRRFLDG